MEENKLQVSEYALEAWSGRIGAKVVAQLDFWNGDPNHNDYGIDQTHLFKLENKKYAVVRESGCSCYDYSDADIEIHTTKKAAKADFESKVLR